MSQLNKPNNPVEKGEQIYQRAKANNLTTRDRLNGNISHHPNSVELMTFLMLYDFHDLQDYFCWKNGGDGDNGEMLMYELDIFFEQKDKDHATRIATTII